MNDDDIPELRPARPDAEGTRPAYMPKLPWKWIGGIGLFLTVSIGTCQYRDKQELTAMRASVLEAHQKQLGPFVERYEKLVDSVFRYTTAAAQKPPERYTDPRLKLDVLGSGKGVYLRLKADQAVDREHIIKAALDVQQDAIARCLGLAPVWFPELYAHGTFLEERFIKQAKDAQDVLKLRVVAEELRQRTQRDLPFVAEWVNAQWFMLVLERGENRREAPVDAYIWDLRTQQLLFSGQAQADGVLVAARIAVTGTTPGQHSSGAQTGAAHDCSIAAKLRALAGGGAPVTFESDPAQRAADASVAAQVSDAGASANTAEAGAQQ